MRGVLMGALVVSCAWSAEGQWQPQHRSTDDVRLVVGTSPALRRVDVRGVNSPSGGTHNEEWTGTPQIGLATGVQYRHGWWLDDDGGLKVGATLQRDSTRGRLVRSDTGDKRAYEVTTMTLTLDAGPTARIDMDSLDFPSDFLEFELLAHAGAGRGSATTGGTSSADFTLLRLGLTAGMVMTTWSRWQVGLEAGYAALSARRLRWGNTDDSTVLASGMVAGLSIGYRW